MTDDDEAPPPKPDYTGISIGDLLTRIQRAHIENLLTLAEGGEMTPQILAQINRFLMDNGVVVGAQPIKTIEGHANQPERKALPKFEQTYDE